VKPVPVRAALLIVTGAVPLEVSVTDCGVAAEFTCTLPNARLVVLTASVGTAAFNCRAKAFDTLPAMAVSVAPCAVATGDTVAGKTALVAPAGTVTVAGTVMAAAVLARLITIPPVGAGPLSATVQESVADPVIEELMQESPLSPTGAEVPVPLSATMVVAPAEELLLNVNWPVVGPSLAGSNSRLNVTACPGSSVTGNAAPEVVNPAPVTDALLIVTGAVPLEVSVTDCGVAAVFTCTLPKAKVVALRVKVGTAAFNCTENVFMKPPAFAVSVTDSEVPTDEAVATKPAFVAPAGTVTVAGAVSAALLLAMLTGKPPLGAAALRVTVQESLADPVIEELLQESPLSAAGADVPVPLRSTAVTAPVEELLLIVSAPVAAPAVAGLN